MIVSGKNLRFFAIAILSGFILLTSSNVFADQKYTDLPDDVVEKIMTAARPHLKDAKISETELVGEETAEQLADPLLSEPEAESALTRGIITEMAKFCGLDWEKKSFDPYMIQQKENGKTPKQLAYFGLLHGIGQGMAEKTLTDKKITCTEDNKKHVATFLYE